MEPFAVCWLCGHPIGVYERLTVVEGGAVRTTSLAREPALGRRPDGLLHETCSRDASDAPAGSDG